MINLQAAARGVKLVLMPPGMAKRSLNTSHFRTHTQTLCWRLHLVFIVNSSFHPSALLRPESHTALSATPTAAAVEPAHGSCEELMKISVTADALVSLSLVAADETRTIADILGDFLDPTPQNSLQRHALRSLRGPRAAGQLRCLIQSIPSSASDPQFCEIPLDFTLRSALENKTIIEYPTLVFGTHEHTHKLRMKIAELPTTYATAAGGVSAAAADTGAGAGTGAALAGADAEAEAASLDLGDDDDRLSPQSRTAMTHFSHSLQQSLAVTATSSSLSASMSAPSLSSPQKRVQRSADDDDDGVVQKRVRFGSTGDSAANCCVTDGNAIDIDGHMDMVMDMDTCANTDTDMGVGMGVDKGVGLNHPSVDARYSCHDQRHQRQQQGKLLEDEEEPQADDKSEEQADDDEFIPTDGLAAMVNARDGSMEGEGEEGEEGEEEGFFAALQEFEGKDIATLQAFIKAAE